MTLKNNKNKYLKNTHISEQQFRSVLKEFCFDSGATETSKRLGMNRNTINRIYKLLRQRIYELSESHRKEKVGGDIEVDESYFGAKRVRGKRGRGAQGKIPVFGLLKRDGVVYVEVITKASKAQLLPIIKGKVLEGSTIYSDGWKSYDGLLVNGYHHYRIYHSHNQFARGKNHVNGIESFWSYAKRRLQKFNGIHKHLFHLHIKECEFRFNHRDGRMYNVLLTELRKRPLGE
jgi:transposase-like protein